MRVLALLLSLFWLSAAGIADGNTLEGAWLEDGIKWIDAPSDINPHLQSAQAAILYFGKDHKFGLIYCTVVRQAKQNMTISNGDPRGVYRGEWNANEHAVSVTYRLVEATILPSGQKLPGPVQSATIKLSAGPDLVFDGKSFSRAVTLDLSADEAVNGIKAPKPTTR